MKKRNFLPLILVVLPYALYAWGNGDRLNDGSCKFDRETGYIGSSLYTKSNESFIIIDAGDSRYGTTSTVYNALTCEKVTSGEKSESNFSGVMQRKGFTEIDLGSKNTLDKSFQNKITFFENSDEIRVHVEPIDSSVTEELNTLLVSLSDKSASSPINISNSAKELLGYKAFYTLFFDKLSSISKTDINYDYALSLIDTLQNNNINVDNSKGVLLAKQEELKEQIARIEKETNDKLFDSYVKGIKDVPQWINKMAQLGKQELIPDYTQTIMSLSDFGKNLNPSNFFNSIEYKYVLKDLKLKNIRKIEDDDKAYGITLEYPNKDIRLTQKPTCTSTGTTSTSEFSCGFLWANTCVGTYEKYNCKGDTSNIANIERQLRGTVKVATVLNNGWSYKHMISRYTKSTPDYSNGSSNRRYQQQQEQEKLMKEQKSIARKSCLAMCEGMSTEGRGIIWDNSPQRKCKDKCWKIY